MRKEHWRRLVHAIAFGRDLTGRAPKELAPHFKRLASEHKSWWNHDNVVGLCLARKITGHRLGRPALQVLVEKKIPHHRLAERWRVPKQIALRGFGGTRTVLTDVKEVGRGRLESLVTADRPAHGGFNVGNETSGSGTLACALLDNSTGQQVGLSCTHVVARYGAAKPGENVWIPSFDEANQLDVSGRAQFGTLLAVPPIGYADEDAANNVDAATFVPDVASALSAVVALLGIKPKTIRDNVALDLPVQKVGFKTGLTFGKVQALNLLASMPYPGENGPQDVWFADQIGISTFTDEGDSGALVLDQAGAAVGLHIGSYNGMSICTPIRRVLAAVGCKLG